MHRALADPMGCLQYLGHQSHYRVAGMPAFMSTRHVAFGAERARGFSRSCKSALFTLAIPGVEQAEGRYRWRLGARLRGVLGRRSLSPRSACFGGRFKTVLRRGHQAAKAQAAR